MEWLIEGIWNWWVKTIKYATTGMFIVGRVTYIFVKHAINGDVKGLFDEIVDSIDKAMNQKKSEANRKELLDAIRGPKKDENALPHVSPKDILPQKPIEVKILKEAPSVLIKSYKKNSIYTARCLVCGRAMKNANSIAHGMGEVCQKKENMKEDFEYFDKHYESFVDQERKFTLATDMDDSLRAGAILKCKIACVNFMMNSMRDGLAKDVFMSSVINSIDPVEVLNEPNLQNAVRYIQKQDETLLKYKFGGK